MIHALAMRFFSDNAASVHPRLLQAMAAANAPDTAYDGDTLSAQLNAAFSDLFETEVEALWVATGTAAGKPISSRMKPAHPVSSPAVPS